MSLNNMDEIKKEIAELKSNLLRETTDIRDELFNHDHDGGFYSPVYTQKLIGEIPSRINVLSSTIATTGNTDIYVICSISGNLISVDFSGVDALAASDTNYITFSITNLGQAGAGTTALLAATDTNTTKATGGTAL